MNFAERITAGPPVLATVGRRALVGDTVVLTLDAQEYAPHLTEAFKVILVRPAIVNGPPALRLRSLLDGAEYDATARAVTVLTKVEAKAAHEHYADVKASQ